MDDAVRLEREGTHSRMVSAYARRHYEALDAAVSPDVTFQMSGSSQLAGMLRGHEAFIAFLEQTAKIVRSAAKPITYVHDGDQLTARREVILAGEVIETTINTTFTFDADGRVCVISVRADDQETFDRVLRTLLERTSISNSAAQERD